jgi:hypothetical protein
MKRHFLALRMQNLPDMRIVLCSLLALITASASAENLCSATLEKTHARYFSELNDLANQEYGLRMGGYAIVTGGAYCLWQTRSFIMCAGLLGAALAGSQSYRYRIMAKMKALEDGYKLYEAYYHLKRGEMDDDTVKALFKETEASKDEEADVAEKFVNMVDSEELCKSAYTWTNVANALKFRKAVVPAAALN